MLIKQVFKNKTLMVFANCILGLFLLSLISCGNKTATDLAKQTRSVIAITKQDISTLEKAQVQLEKELLIDNVYILDFLTSDAHELIKIEAVRLTGQINKSPNNAFLSTLQDELTVSLKSINDNLNPILKANLGFETHIELLNKKFISSQQPLNNIDKKLKIIAGEESVVDGLKLVVDLLKGLSEKEGNSDGGDDSKSTNQQ